MYISYENESGKIDLNSGRWRLKEIEGLGLCEKLETKVSYQGIDGSELISAVTESRTITMSGDILIKEKGTAEITRAIKILNKGGTLKIQAGGKRRKIKVRCAYFRAEKGDKRANYQQFVLQLTADYPFFEEFTGKKISLFYREDLIKDSFTLPCMFSRRISRIKAVNSGDVKCMPKVYIICQKEGNSGNITLINHTTEKQFSLDYSMTAGEEICIDFENRKITSNIKDKNGGNLLSYMTQDSYLSEFYFEEGINDIEVLSLGEGSEMTAFCEYNPKFVEAVV